MMLAGQQQQTKLTGSIWLDKSEQRFLGQKRVELLRQIAATGSITHAAKAVNLLSLIHI